MKLRPASLGKMFAMAAIAVPSVASAHWCDDLWESAYNIVIRPEADTVTVPSTGSATLAIFVQNNMGYALPNFELVADIGGTAIKPSRQSQKVTGTLLPGEKAKYNLPISKSGGGQVTVEQINFSIKFGESGMTQWGMYPTPDAAKAVVIKKTTGATVPATPLTTAPSASRGQSKQLELAAKADFIDLEAGLDGLLQLYCSGRGSWNSNSAAVITSWCADTKSTNCQTKTLGTGAGTKYDYPRLWAAGELAARKASLGCARMNVLRNRLKCGITSDPNLGFSGYAMMVLGYLGEDPAMRTFIQSKIDAGGDLGTISKAALLLFGNAADSTKYLADVKAGVSASNQFVSAACAAALGIVNRDDATVTSALIPKAKWIEPDTNDNGQAMYAAHLLALVAWDRRGYAAKAGDEGAVSFIEGGTATPFAPGESCPGGVAGTGGTPAVTGGTTAATGGTVARTGGVAATGGTTTPTGGVSTSGGTTVGTGGSTVRTGGTAVSSGGIVTSTGGVSVVAGGATAPTGGVKTGTGGAVTSAGGASVSGGSIASTGGTVSSNGGGVAPTGGTVSTETSTNTSTTTTTDKGSSSSGCSVSANRSETSPVGWMGFLVALGAFLFGARRRRR